MFLLWKDPGPRIESVTLSVSMVLLSFMWSVHCGQIPEMQWFYLHTSIRFHEQNKQMSRSPYCSETSVGPLESSYTIGSIYRFPSVYIYEMPKASYTEGMLYFIVQRSQTAVSGTKKQPCFTYWDVGESVTHTSDSPILEESFEFIFCFGSTVCCQMIGVVVVFYEVFKSHIMISRGTSGFGLGEFDCCLVCQQNHNKQN